MKRWPFIVLAAELVLWAALFFGTARTCSFLHGAPTWCPAAAWVVLILGPVVIAATLVYVLVVVARHFWRKRLA